MALFNHFSRSFPTISRRGATKFRVGALAAFALLGCDTSDKNASYNFTETSVGLHAFDDCDELSAYFQAEANALLDEFDGYEIYGQPGFGIDDAVGAPQAEDGGERGGATNEGGERFSRTNTQEADVDEPDLVKTDGRWLYLVRNGYFLIYDASDLSLQSKIQAPGYDGRIMLHGDTVILMSTAWGESDLGQGVSTTALIYDVSDRSKPRELRRMVVQGQLVAARAAKGTARLAIQYDATEKLAERLDVGGPVGRTPTPIDFDGDDAPIAEPAPAPKEDSAADWKKAARALIAETTATDWLPQMVDSAGAQGQAVGCGAMFRPGERAGLTVTALVSVDLNEPTGALRHTGVVSGAGVVYASADNLYLTTQNRIDFGGGVARGDDVAIGGVAEPASTGRAVIASPLAAEDRQATQIHRLSIEDPARAPIYQGTARVFGAPLNQFSLSDHEGHLRVATTEQSADRAIQQTNNVTVIDNKDMEITGTIENIAKTERIYAARFMGDRGFVVTFRQVDPLFTLDLSDPSDPQLVGELKVPGFSTYLHPIGDEHLIGIGRSATDEGFDTGMQLSLFDVSKFEAPTLAHEHRFGEAWSEAQYDHHAFTYWGDRSLLFVPIQAWEQDAQRTGVDVFKVSIDGGFLPVGHITHEQEWSSVQRSVVIGDMVYTISSESMRATGLDGLDDAGSVDFPQAEGGADRGGAEPGVIEG